MRSTNRGLTPPPRPLLLALALIALPACQQQMARSPAYKPLQGSAFFRDGRASRPLVPGTIARGQLRTDTALYEGKDANGKLVTEFPFQMTKEVLRRGQERYGIFCIVCHGPTGNGDGRIAQRSFTQPPSYHTDLSRAYKLRSPPEKVKLTDVPVGHIFDVITRGFGAMPDHAEQIPVRDRWAIAGYVKALQYSQSGKVRQAMSKGGKP